jgi:Na+/melibiose symporter-like transporter
MGFGGGAMIGAPLSVFLMKHFSSPTSVGVAETFMTMGCIYLVFMMIGAFSIRLPEEGWLPVNFQPDMRKSKLITDKHVHVEQVLKTPQFYLLWLVLCLNVTAGIGVLGQASAMSQEMFKDQITPEKAAAFVGMLSFFNMGGRFFWSTLSDYLGRKNVYFTFFMLGCVLYSIVPYTGRMNNVLLFMGCYAVIMSMYGGGFSTIPAYLADIFGTRYVGAIHGRLLTAWATAGVAGPVLVNYLRESQIAQGVPKADAYNMTMQIMAGLLLVGFFCNLGIKAVDEKHHIQHDQVNDEYDAA